MIMPKRYLPLFFMSVFMITGCHTDLKSKRQNTSIINTKKEIVNKSSDEDTLLKDSNIIIIGDKSKPVEEAIDKIRIRFKPLIRFSDFPVQKYDSQIRASINYSSNPLAKQFKTTITNLQKRHKLRWSLCFCRMGMWFPMPYECSSRCRYGFSLRGS